MHYEFLKGYEAKREVLNVNVHAVQCTVSVKWFYEDEPIDVDFGSEAENNAYISRFDRNGDLCNIVITVVARGEGLEGLDHLGCNHVKWVSFDADVLETITDNGMTETALEELRKAISDASQKLAKYSVKGTDFADSLCQTRLKGG